MQTSRFMALCALFVVMLVCAGCGGGSGGGGNAERVIAILPVDYDFATADNTDPIPFCFANLTCQELMSTDQLGVAITLAQVSLNSGPGSGPIQDTQTPLFDVLAGRLTDNQLDPLAASFVIGGVAPGCIEGDESDLVLQEARPVPGVDLAGFEVTAMFLAIDSISRTSTRVTMSGRVVIRGRTAPSP